MPDGIYGWFTGGGLRSFLASFGIAQKARTYPKIDEQIESLQEVVSTTPTDSSA